MCVNLWRRKNLQTEGTVMTETFDAGKLADELRSLVSEAEALLRSGVSSGTAELQDRAQETVRELKGRLAGLEQQLNARARDVDSYVRDNPWQAVAVAGGVALLLGLIMARR
jgi:ElaB/YqjD/DUF883 family membrane-anchored ribosome-binding protein